MKRTAAETAHILSDLYDETFGRDSFEPFRITWPQLRSLTAVRRLNENFLKDISEALSESERCLIPFNEFLLVTGCPTSAWCRTGCWRSTFPVIARIPLMTIQCSKMVTPNKQ